MRKYSLILSAIAVFIFTVTGIGYVAYTRATTKKGTVLGEQAPINLALSIEFNSKRITYTTRELKQGATLTDLFRRFDQESAIGLELRKSGQEDRIYRIDEYLSNDLIYWRVYVNEVEYQGIFSELALKNNDVVRVVYQ